jgi:hypothetical protein
MTQAKDFSLESLISTHIKSKFDGQVVEIFLAKNHVKLHFQANHYQHLHSYITWFHFHENIYQQKKESLSSNNIMHKLIQVHQVQAI